MTPWLKSFFEETVGTGSMARLVCFLITCLMMFVVLVECELALLSKDLKWPELPMGLAGFLGTLFLVALGAKTAQSILGEKGPTTTSTITTAENNVGDATKIVTSTSNP